MIVYAESSAVLAWLFEEKEAPGVAEIFELADLVTASRLTVVESYRALHRARALGSIDDEGFRALELRLEAATATWLLLDLDADTIAGACDRFPEEPIRSLDALHLASAAILGRSLPGTLMVSLDHRLRANCRALGFRLLPDSPVRHP